MAGHDEVIITGVIVRDEETDLAILFDMEGQEEWIPRSQISCKTTIDGENDLTIPEWLAEANGYDYR